MAFASETPKKDNLLRTLSFVDDYNHDIQFYPIEVHGLVKLEDLREMSKARIMILRNVLEIADHNSLETQEDCREELLCRLRKWRSKPFADLFQGNYSNADIKKRQWARWVDHVSHNGVCLALCVSPGTQRWLVEAELQLLKWRLLALTDEEIKAVMRIQNMNYPMVDENEKMRLKEDLTTVMDEPEKFDETRFYKVPYEEAISADNPRSFHVASGVAYFTISFFRHIICYHFESHLKTQMKCFRERLYRTINDPRITELIRYLQEYYLSTKSWTMEMGPSLDEELNLLAENSFPPCVRKLHDALRRDHHLRYQGRVNYIVFLKAIGVTASKAEKLIRSEFTKNMSESTFVKEYQYFVRHLFGLVGGKINYKVFECSKHAKQIPETNEYHGCPFVVEDIEDLHKSLDCWKVPSSHKSKIVQLAREKKFESACSAYFEAKHGCRIGCKIVNPMDFYSRSKDLSAFRQKIQSNVDSDNEENTEEVETEFLVA